MFVTDGPYVLSNVGKEITFQADQMNMILPDCMWCQDQLNLSNWCEVFEDCN